MDPTSVAILTGAVVVAGQWSQGKKLDAKTIVGGTMYAIMITVLADVNTSVVEPLALLVLFGAMMNYVPPLVKSLGLVK